MSQQPNLPALVPHKTGPVYRQTCEDAVAVIKYHVQKQTGKKQVISIYNFQVTFHHWGKSGQ